MTVLCSAVELTRQDNPALWRPNLKGTVFNWVFGETGPADLQMNLSFHVLLARLGTPGGAARATEGLKKARQGKEGEKTVLKRKSRLVKAD